MNKCFFTSDTHFHHGNIIRYCNRPFMNEHEIHNEKEGLRYPISQQSIEKMNDTIIDGINKTVGADDTLFHLGDFMFGGRQRDDFLHRARAILDRINCKDIVVVSGNHDNYQHLRELFGHVQPMREITVNNQKITLCHYAMVVWNCSHHGAWQLYGHSHAGIEKAMDQMLGGGRLSLDVGVDNAYRLLGEYRPFSFDEIAAHFEKNKKNGVRHLHH